MSDFKNQVVIVTGAAGALPGLPMRPPSRWQFMIALPLSVPLFDWLMP